MYEKKASMSAMIWVACCLSAVHVSLEPYISMIFLRAPFKERAKGP
jgi:hypothetical protein